MLWSITVDVYTHFLSHNFLFRLPVIHTKKYPSRHVWSTNPHKGSKIVTHTGHVHRQQQVDGAIVRLACLVSVTPLSPLYHPMMALDLNQPINAQRYCVRWPNILDLISHGGSMGIYGNLLFPQIMLIYQFVCCWYITKFKLVVIVIMTNTST